MKQNKSFRINQNITDGEFDSIYPRRIRRIAANHFTPVSVAKAAADFLVTSSGTKVLDIGSGAGKFCMIGAACTAGHFTGIEQRLELVDVSKALAFTHKLENVAFINANVTSIDFADYDAFYLYNSFQENIESHNRIDDSILLTPTLYNAYTAHTMSQLGSMRQGTRLVTYYTATDIIPVGYLKVKSAYDEKLNFWEKTK